MQAVGVECAFDGQGMVQVHRIEKDGRWVAVEQGRQWLADNGRHVLVLVGGSRPAELVLQSDTLTWMIKWSSSPGGYVV